MRVMHVYRTYFPDTQGGLEECIRQICLSTRRLGAENRVLSLSRCDRPDIVVRPEAEVHRFPLSWEAASNGVSVKAWSSFGALSEWADIIHYHFPWPFADLMHLRHRPRCASVVTYHSDVVRQRNLFRWYSPIMNQFLRRMDRIVATSPAYPQTSPVLGRFRSKVSVIPIGIDSASYPPITEEKLNWACIAGGKPFFLFVGVLRYYKGLHVLLDAVAGTELQLIIVGSGPLDRTLRKEVAQRGLRNVRFLGHVSDVEKVALIMNCTAMVLPSHLRSEGFGISLLEGAMHGKPLISTEIGTGTSYVNEHLKTGIVIPPGDASMLREAMIYMIRHPDMAEKMGGAARERYLRLFTGGIMGDAYYSLYRDVLSADGSSNHQSPVKASRDRTADVD